MRFIPASLALLLLPIGLSAQNLLINPSFDTLASGSGNIVNLDSFNGDAGSLDGWNLFGVGANGGTNSVDGTTVYGAPQAGTRFVALGGGGSGNGRGLFQTFFATAGQTYAVSIYARYFGGAENVRGGFVAEDTSGGFTTRGEVTFAVNPTGAEVALTDAWQLFSFEFTAVNTSLHRLVLRDFTTNGIAPNTDLLMDSASLTAIPEPASAATLVGLGMLGFMVSRRRRAVRG